MPPVLLLRIWKTTPKKTNRARAKGRTRRAFFANLPGFNGRASIVVDAAWMRRASGIRIPSSFGATWEAIRRVTTTTEVSSKWSFTFLVGISRTSRAKGESRNPAFQN